MPEALRMAVYPSDKVDWRGGVTADQLIYLLYVQNLVLQDQFRTLFIDTVRAIVGALETRDPYTHGHSIRVSHYAVMIGEKLNLPTERLHGLELAALLHDIGKIGTPDQILHKIQSLNTAEFNVMKLHPLTGAELLSQVDALKPLAPFVKHHHERFDGKGYPDGLMGDGIPLESRIIIVADTYDAMTTTRSYRKGLEKKVALKELQRCSGSQFDPKIVEVFTTALENFETHTESLMDKFAQEKKKAA